MIAALLPLFAAVPIAMAAVVVLVPSLSVRRALTHLTTVALLLSALWTLVAVHPNDVFVTQVGGFAPGISIPFILDPFSAIMLAVSALVTGCALLFADVSGEFNRSRYFPALALMLVGGANGALLTGDLFNLFVFVEVMLLPSYALVAVTGMWRRLAVGRLFVIVNLLTSTLLLAAIGLTYGTAGSVNMAVLAGAAQADGRTAAAVGLILLALCIKAGAAPVHGWLPRAYPATSPAVMALFSGLHTKVALYAIVRLWSVVFDLDSGWGMLLLAMALLTTVWGALGSLGPNLVREVLAFQMVSGVGVILAAMVIGTITPGALSAGGETSAANTAAHASMVAAIVYMVHHMLTMGSLITSYGAVERTYGTGRLDRVSGLSRREPTTAVLIAFGTAALIGLPFTSGIVGKFEVVSAAASAGLTPAGVVTIFAVLIASLFGLIAMVRVWRETMWGPDMTHYRPCKSDFTFGQWQDLPAAGSSNALRVRPALLAPSAILASASLFIFLGYGLVTPFVNSAADALVDTSSYVRAVLT